jgi:poly(3-hydroxybutyrate) depolymerase
MLCRVSLAARVLIATALVACSDDDIAGDGGDPFTVLPPDAAASDGGDPRERPGDRPGGRDAATDAARPGDAADLDARGEPPVDASTDADIDPTGDDGGATPGGGDPEPPFECSGKPGAPGNTTRTYDGREYIVHVPPNAPPNRALPVVFAFHGAGMRGSEMFATGFDVLGDEEGFVTVYPNGGGQSPWNVGSGACLPGGLASSSYDDFAYVEHMLDDVEQDQCIDREHVFATGFSMGGYFSHHIGCQRGNDLVRAVAPHSGGTYGGECPAAPVPVLILHGDADPLIGVGCAEQGRDQWVERNGCAEDFDVIDILGGHCEWHRACPANGQVVLCTFDGLEHTWAGLTPDYDHSTLLIWEFWKHYL